MPVDNSLAPLTSRMRPIANAKIARWRKLDAAAVLGLLAEYAKDDVMFVAKNDPTSSRWHSSVGGRDFEIVCTGPKFWDTRSGSGGGGALDLIMHLTGLDFRAAAKLLEKRNI